MHKLNVRILGSTSFISTLNELKVFLKFNPILDSSNINPNVILFHIDALHDKKQREYIHNNAKLLAFDLFVILKCPFILDVESSIVLKND